MDTHIEAVQEKVYGENSGRDGIEMQLKLAQEGWMDLSGGLVVDLSTSSVGQRRRIMADK